MKANHGGLPDCEKYTIAGPISTRNGFSIALERQTTLTVA
jgi:hypothetical protein